MQRKTTPNEMRGEVDRGQDDQAASTSSPKIRWAHIGVEFTAIVFGVLLGLALNEWRLDVRQVHEIEAVETAILDELTENYETILQTRNYHVQQYKAAQTRRHSSLDDGFNYRGLMPPNTTRAALDAGVASAQFAKMDQERGRIVMRLYNEIDDIQEVHDRYANAMVLIEQKSLDDFLRQVSQAFSDMLYAEDDALVRMAVALGKTPPDAWWDIKPMIDAEIRVAASDATVAE